MSDYLGPNQTRVLDAENRSFERVVYQKKKPPLSCEVNLTGDLAARSQQDLSGLVAADGWVFTGGLKNNVTTEFPDNTCMPGDVVTSPAYGPNRFKLIGLDRGVETNTLIAWVNGWKVLVQGTNSNNADNMIILPEPPDIGTQVNFVFLEVWQKLIMPSDPVIYKYGNILYGGVSYANDLIDPAVGIETSLRVQIQYRIRVVEDVDIENNPEGFDPNNVFVQGPLQNPNETCSHAYFSQVPGRPGLWRAGAGDTAAQEDLGTVDGYTYAIPMFAISRRNTHSFEVVDYTNGSSKVLTDYLAGTASDRPDNLYNNWVVADDILDMRHRISTSDNFKEMCQVGFNRLIHGGLRGKMQLSTVGEDHFGTIMTQVDAVSLNTGIGAVTIAAGNGSRRIFSNCSADQPDTIFVRTINDKVEGTSGDPWTYFDAVEVTLTGYPTDSVIQTLTDANINDLSLAGYTWDWLPFPGTPSNQIKITLGGTFYPDYPPYNTSPIVFNVVVSLPNGKNGLSELPVKFLEVRPEDSTVCIATMEADVRLRGSAPVVTLQDGTNYNMLSNRGAFRENFDFGHQMIYHVEGNSTGVISIPRNIEGLDILGVMSAKTKGDYKVITGLTRDVLNYTITLDSITEPGHDVELKLYTATKFFNMNKQGRAILETYEMKELTPEETPDGFNTEFTLNTTNVILAIASNRDFDGKGIAYVNDVQTELLTENQNLPALTNKTYIKVNFAMPPAGSATIRVPVLMYSAIESSEGYNFFYQTVPYQGLLTTNTSGVLEAEGSAITTSSGSGAFTNFSYFEGAATFMPDSTVVTGLGTEWLSNIRAGQFLSITSETPVKKYRIAEVESNTILHLSRVPDLTEGYPVSYSIEWPDHPSFSQANIIDRLPTVDVANDSLALNEMLSTAVTDFHPVIETRIASRTQDMLDVPPNQVNIGVTDSTDGRGRHQIHIQDASIGLGNLGLKFEKLDGYGTYQKTFQSYILNQENTGKLYLMVVGTETGNDTYYRIMNPASNLDSVDIFELPGRPLTVRKTE